MQRKIAGDGKLRSKNRAFLQLSDNTFVEVFCMNPFLENDVHRGKHLARLLYHSFATTGIHGKTEMPEDILPAGIMDGSLEHLLFITLTVSIDYQRDASALWAISRQTFEDPETRYLFNPASLHSTRPGQIKQDMQKYGLSKKMNGDPHIWRTIGVTFHKKYNGNPLNFLEDCHWDSLMILHRLQNETHLYEEKEVPDFPYLRGNKIGPLWLRMLRDNVGIEKLKNLELVPIPVDIHIARATLATGVVKGSFSGNLVSLFERLRMAWAESVRGLYVKNRPMIALDVDEPLWHLSKYGCTKRDKITGKCPSVTSCEAKKFCISGSIEINKNHIELRT